MKPTIVNSLFGAILLGGLAFGRSLLGYVFDAVFQPRRRGLAQADLPLGRCSSSCWRVLNEVIWRNFSTDFWVSFKVFGIMPLTVALHPDADAADPAPFAAGRE